MSERVKRWRFLGAVALLTTTGCAAAKTGMRAELEPMAFTAEAMPSTPPVLTENHFRRDGVGSISETDLRKVLESPVFLEADARVGVLPVAGTYTPDMEVPLPGVPAVLSDALDASGEFELASEISTDFPADRGISGLRELAARYRADYLLIYRHRFVERNYLNAWAFGYATGVGALFLPGNTVETAGVLEATLFDVKTGTILFTVLERVGDSEQVNNWHTELKTQWMQKRLLETASQKLSDQVIAKVRRLAAARPAASGQPKQMLSSGAPRELAPVSEIPVLTSTVQR